LGTDELTLKTRLSILEQQLDDLDEVRVKLVEGFGLGVRARPSGDVPYIEEGIGITLDDGSVAAHGLSLRIVVL
jgi:hypothetical protein